MTGRTHDLAALTALNIFIATQYIPALSLTTAVASLMACFIGGLFPDIDKPSSDIWDKIPGGSILSRLAQPFLGAHRHLSHSLLGLCLYGYAVRLLLLLAASVILVDMRIVWVAFMIGMVSHLIMDSLTKEGVPWLFPIPVRLKMLGIKTGGWGEKLIVFPGLVTLNVYLVYSYYGKYLEIFRHLV